VVQGFIDNAVREVRAERGANGKAHLDSEGLVYGLNELRKKPGRDGKTGPSGAKAHIYLNNLRTG